MGKDLDHGAGHDISQTIDTGFPQKRENSRPVHDFDSIFRVRYRFILCRAGTVARSSALSTDRLRPSRALSIPV